MDTKKLRGLRTASESLGDYHEQFISVPSLCLLSEPTEAICEFHLVRLKRKNYPPHLSMKMSCCDLLCDRGWLQLRIIFLPSKMTAVFSTGTTHYPQTRITVTAAKIPTKQGASSVSLCPSQFLLQWLWLFGLWLFASSSLALYEPQKKVERPPCPPGNYINV